MSEDKQEGVQMEPPEEEERYREEDGKDEDDGEINEEGLFRRQVK